jgi:hypothetical protein
MAAKKGHKKPKFPRKKWKPGQAPRVEPPKKGKGASYRRTEEEAEAEEEVADYQADDEK